MSNVSRIIGRLEALVETHGERMDRFEEHIDKNVMPKLDKATAELAEHRGAMKKSTFWGSAVGSIAGVLTVIGVKLGVGH